MLPPEKIGVPDTKEHQAFLVPNTDWGVPDHFGTHNTPVTVLWHPLVDPKGPHGVTGLKKEPVEVSVL